MQPARSPMIRGSTGLVAVPTLAAGLWALIWPRSFYLRLAPFPPYNQHLIHDIGTFQIGLGGCLVASLLVADVLLVALAGNTLASVAHFGTHFVDRHQGGHAADPAAYGAIALLLILITGARWATYRNRGSATQTNIEQGEN